MPKLEFVCWEDEGAWLGHLREYPEYCTRGETLADLKEHLLDMHCDLTSGVLNAAVPPSS